ncbi:MAG: ACP S-malonyltransferase [Acidobacteria bacterium]|nr:ACP S-malonyltransferase [Acidobacteriota bacterium]
MSAPRWAALFPGQGSQSVGMGRELAAAWPEAAEVFATADDVLGESLSRLCFEGPESELVLTRNTQPALLTVSIAAWRVLAARVPPPVVAAGHSLGEYSALVAAGVLPFADALLAVRERGEAMQAAVPVGVGAMAAVIGAAPEIVERLCREAAAGDEVVVAANFNAPDQTVVAGHAAAVARLAEAAPAAGARRVIPLPVSAPFHSPLMRPAAERLARYFQHLRFREGAFPVIANASATPLGGGDTARASLVEQVASPVRWVETIRQIEGPFAVEVGVEVGPGKVLAGLTRRIAELVNALGFARPEDLEAVVRRLVPGASAGGCC